MKNIILISLFLSTITGCIVGEYTFPDKGADYPKANFNRKVYICHAMLQNKYYDLDEAKESLTDEEYDFQLEVLKGYSETCSKYPEIYKLF